MPKKLKIEPGERQNWLELSEQGVLIVTIANESKRDVRSVKVHIEKARLERSFELAQRNQLERALQGHQDDLLGLLRNLKESINVPGLDYVDPVGLDFGLEDIWSTTHLVRNREALIPRQSSDPHETAVFNVIRDINGPQEIQLVTAVSRLWSALKEHIRQGALWRHEAAWRDSYLVELQRRAHLNRAIRANAEGIFGLKVGLKSLPGDPWLAPATISWIRACLTNDSLGNYVRPFDEEITETSPGSLRTMQGQELTVGIEDAKARIQEILSAMAGNKDVAAAAESYNDLVSATEIVHNEIDGYLLIHYITGLCGLCKKLGGQ